MADKRYPFGMYSRGAKVRVHYRRECRQGTLELHPLPHGATGRVVLQAHGRGPRNVLVGLDGGGFLVVPRGNVRKQPEEQGTT